MKQKRQLKTTGQAIDYLNVAVLGKDADYPAVAREYEGVEPLQDRIGGIEQVDRDITDRLDVIENLDRDISDQLANKADKSQVAQDLALKANTSVVEGQLALKADKTELTPKADITYVDSELANKIDASNAERIIGVTTQANVVNGNSTPKLVSGKVIKDYLDSKLAGIAEGAEVRYDDDDKRHYIYGAGLIDVNYDDMIIQLSDLTIGDYTIANVDNPDNFLYLGDDTSQLSGKTRVEISSPQYVLMQVGPNMIELDDESVSIKDDENRYRFSIDDEGFLFSNTRDTDETLLQISRGSTNVFIPFVNAKYTTALRPTDVTVGAQIFDTTLGQPIWFNGTIWVDAMGEPV